jgi:uncharacterized protein YqiB (DUF1249 family)
MKTRHYYTKNNPSAFFRLYHDAYKIEEEGFVLSNRAMDFLERREKMLAIKNE